MEHYGQVDASSTVYLFFTTHAASGAAVAPSTAFEVADIKLYKNGSATERSSNAGWTITSPFDSIVGLHLLAIDLSDNTDAGFYAAGSRYTAVLSPDETVDGLAVVRVIADFSIGPVSANTTQFAGTAITSAAGIPEVKVASIAANAITATAIAADAITDAKVASDVTIASVTGAVGSVTGAVGSVTGAVGSVTGAVGSVTGNVGGNVVGTVASVVGNVGGNVTGTVASVVNLSAAQSEPTGVPAANASPLAKLAFIAAIARNKITQTATTQTVLADDGVTPIAASTVSDDGTTATRGEFA